jgi:transcriptional regulator with XRE-family HTH domain
VAQVRYHYGLTIREGREEAHMTQAQLAEKWPQANGGSGVSVNYVSEVERGIKHITDPQTLRRLCDILQIPYWKMGLSKYDPFNPTHLPGKGKYLYDETLDAIETLIDNAWILRHTSSFPVVIKNVERLESLFKYLSVYASRQSKLEARYNKLYAQFFRLKGMICVEERDEVKANQAFNTMYKITEEIDDPVGLALACMGLGAGYTRVGNHKEAIRYLEKARDYTFETSRQLSGLVTAFLARSYAKDGDTYHFERAIDTSIRIAKNLGAAYGDGTDFCRHTLSDVLEEKTNGYIELGLGQKVIDMTGEIEKQIKLDNNNYLTAWIPLDYAQAYLTMDEVDESMTALYNFYLRMTGQLQSPLVFTKINTHMIKLKKKGYNDIKAVKDFREKLLLGHP